MRLAADVGLRGIILDLAKFWSPIPWLLEAAMIVSAVGVRARRTKDQCDLRLDDAKYLTGMYRIPETALSEGLGLLPGRDPNTSLKSLADEAGVSPPQYVRRVQRVIAQHTPLAGLDRDNAGSGWVAAIADRVLTALLVYGYPVLGLALLLGAIGLPLPGGLAMIVAGSLAGQERVSWIGGGIALIASVVGVLLVTVLAARSVKIFSITEGIGSDTPRRGERAFMRCSSDGVADRFHHAHLHLLHLCSIAKPPGRSEPL